MRLFKTKTQNGRPRVRDSPNTHAGRTSGWKSHEVAADVQHACSPRHDSLIRNGSLPGKGMLSHAIEARDTSSAVRADPRARAEDSSVRIERYRRVSATRASATRACVGSLLYLFLSSGDISNRRDQRKRFEQKAAFICKYSPCRRLLSMQRS